MYFEGPKWKKSDRGQEKGRAYISEGITGPKDGKSEGKNSKRVKGIQNGGSWGKGG